MICFNNAIFNFLLGVFVAGGVDVVCATPGRLNDLLKRGVMVCVGVCWRGGMVLGMWYIYICI